MSTIKGNKNLLNAIKNSLKKYRLGELLVKKGLISESQLELALNEQKKTGDQLGRILVKQGYVSSLQIYRKLTEQWCIRIATLVIAVSIQVIIPSASGQAQNLSTAHVLSSYQLNNNHIKLFGSNEVMSSDIAPFKKWTSAMNRYHDQLKSITTKAPRLIMWKKEINTLKYKSRDEQVSAINNFFNKVRYIEDSQNYKRKDFWATPVEFMSKGGDCEDYAIAKYSALIDLGFKAEDLRIAVVQDQEKNTPHAVLVVKLNNELLILDNQNNKIEKSESVTHYKPIFSINSKNWWLHKT